MVFFIARLHSPADKFVYSWVLLIMVVWLGGAQFILVSYEWVTKLDDNKARVQVVSASVITEKLDDKKSCYQLIKIATTFEEETRHLLYVFIRKQLLTPWNAWQQLAQMMLSVHVRRYDVSTVLLHCPITSIDCPIGAQIGLVITNHVLEFYYSFD